MCSFSLLLLEGWGNFFSDIYCGNLTKLLEINLTILWGLPMIESPWIFNYQSCIHWTSSNSSVTYRSSFLTSVVVPTATSACELMLCPVCLGFLYLPVLTILEATGLLLMVPGEDVNFSVCSDFLLVRTELHIKPKIPNICDFNLILVWENHESIWLKIYMYNGRKWYRKNEPALFHISSTNCLSLRNRYIFWPWKWSCITLHFMCTLYLLNFRIFIIHKHFYSIHILLSNSENHWVILAWVKYTLIYSNTIIL